VAKWFYLEEGRAKGPFPREFISQKIKSGELKKNDLVFREGTKKWEPLEAQEDFQNDWPQAPVPPPEPSLSEIPEWILLQPVRSDGKKAEYQQSGPFTSERITEMIAQGAAQYSDYIWKPSFSEWRRIGEVEDLKPTHAAPPPLHSIPESDWQVAKNKVDELGENTLMSQVIHQEVKFNQDDLETVILNPLDRAELFNNLKKTETVPEESSPVALVQEEVSVVKKQKSKERQSRPAWQGWAINFALGAMILGGLSVYFYFRATSLLDINAGQNNDPVAEVPASTPTPPPPVVATPEVSPDREVAKSKTEETFKSNVAQSSDPKAPVKVLRLTPLKLSSARPQLVIETDAAPGRRIEVRFRADAGSVLRKLSVYRTTYVTVRSNEVPTLDLGSMGLPKGTYQVEAELGDTSVRKRLFIGEKNEAFQKDLNRHRKQSSFLSQSEKKNLFHLAKNLEDRSSELFKEYYKRKAQPQDWSEFYRTWKKKFQTAQRPELKRVNERNNENMAFPEMWLELKKARSKLDDTAKEMDSQVKLRKPAASALSAELPAKIKMLRVKTAQLSLWQ
jgi:hypothetical protein